MFFCFFKSNNEAGNPNDYNGNQHGQFSQGQDNAKVPKKSILIIRMQTNFLIYSTKLSYLFCYFYLVGENAKRKRTT